MSGRRENEVLVFALHQVGRQDLPATFAENREPDLAMVFRLVLFRDVNPKIAKPGENVVSLRQLVAVTVNVAGPHRHHFPGPHPGSALQKHHVGNPGRHERNRRLDHGILDRSDSFSF